MRESDRWLQFRLGSGRFAVPVSAVLQVVGLGELQPTTVPGWAGLLPLGGGVLPLADGGALVGLSEERSRRSRGLILRGRIPLGFTADSVHGVVAGSAFPLVDGEEPSRFAVAALPAAEGSVVVLDSDRVWRSLFESLVQRTDGSVDLAPLPFAPAVVPVNPALMEFTLATRGPLPAPSETEAPARELVVAGSTGKSRRDRLAEGRRGPATVIVPPTVSPSPPIPNRPRPERLDRPRKLLLFSVGAEFDLAVPLESVADVTGPLEMPPREADDGQRESLGLWRGQAVPVLDLVRIAGGMEQVLHSIVLQLDGADKKRRALTASRVLGTAELAGIARTSRFSAIPARWTLGVARMGTRPLVVLEPSALVEG